MTVDGLFYFRCSPQRTTNNLAKRCLASCLGCLCKKTIGGSLRLAAERGISLIQAARALRHFLLFALCFLSCYQLWAGALQIALREDCKTDKRKWG